MGNCCDTRVLPVHTTATPSSSVEEKHPKSSSKVESRRGQNSFKILRTIHHNSAVIPGDAEQPQALASTSREKPQALPKHADSASSEDEEKSPLRRVKVASRKSRKGSSILKTLRRKGILFMTDVQGCQFIDETCPEKPQNRREVNPEEVPPVPGCPDSATLPMDKEKAPVIMVEVASRKRRCVSTILKNFSRKRAVAPLKMERPQALAGTSRETAHVTTEVVPENADTASPAGGQAEPPVGMERVATTKRRRMFSFLRGMCQNTTVTPQGPERPSVSEAASTKTTEMKTKDIPEHTDNTLAPDVNEETSETMESEEARKRRRISELIKRIEQKQAMGPQYGIGTQAFSVTSPETTVKNEKGNATEPSPVEETSSVSMTKQVEPRRFKCFSSLLKRFYKKDPGPSQALEEPPVLESTSKEIPQQRKRGIENVPDIKQIFCREEEFEPHDEGSWEEYKSYFPGGVHVPESKHTMASTMVGSYTAQVGDTDIEEQQQDLDSKEDFPDAIEIQQWELRKVSSTVAPVADTLFVAPPTSSEDDEYVSIRRKKRKKWRRRYY